MLITACSLPILLFNGIDVYLNHALDPINIGFTLVFFILAALAEEILCRVVFLGLLVEKYGEWNSLIASSLLFMALHFLNPNVTPVAAINLFLAGILLGQVFLYSGKNLLFATIFHMGWNFTQGSLFGFSVSGMAIGQSLLIQQAPAGSAWSGKNFGLEGSVECTVVLILAISLLSWRQSKRAHSGTAQEPDTLLFTRGLEKAELAGRQYPQDRTLR
ncbi:lysostaphin resistance A-like protein [Arcticibacter sp. MXS-1]|uniref:CPBP family intramembrane glutamic endopeptidase n=1 Tax=Arcticibacter sp. MXS-1 TaxID=3341726 RepID=UPI0035A8ED99